MVDFTKEVLKSKILKMPIDFVMEKLRASLVFCMRLGDTLVINVDKKAMDFINEFNCVEFPTEKIFDSGFWKAKEQFNYLCVVKPEEDLDLVQNKKMYVM